MKKFKQKYATMTAPDMSKQLRTVALSLIKQSLLMREDPKAPGEIYRLRYQRALLLTYIQQRS